MIRFSGLLILGLCVLLSLSGCSGKSTSKADSAFTTQFQGANPESKAKAELIVSAFKTNNYVIAITTLQDLAANGSPTPAQQKSIEKMHELVVNKMYQEVEKVDTNAIMSRDILQELRRRRR